ncbi:glycosyltransferase family 2 protein [Wenzhouxiangella limi]|uniref:Glycosyltransferase n=1 Tax=Wenzhouxiangella limi TaxID=2707351 RepID=A0A845V544_9GAMM|nr:glycosyltransferase [Wenzhouxiangella limi]NDY96306.1 glycosyltransferase [Wenzhouxiangella limi]
MTLSLTEAHRLFETGQYRAALKLYEEFKAVTGVEWVDYSIAQCRARLGQSESGIDSSGIAVDVMDPVTRILLSNANKAALSDDERRRLIQELRKQWENTSQPIEVSEYPQTVPSDWPDGLELPALPESTNDYCWMLRHFKDSQIRRSDTGLSVIIPTFNRPHHLAITLACLCHQQTQFVFEVLVVDDGSSVDIEGVVRGYESKLDVKYLRQPDSGYRLCAARNLGIRAARHDWIAILDCDMAPSRGWVQSYCEALSLSWRWALIGPRKYIDTGDLDVSDFLNDPDYLETVPLVLSKNELSGKRDGEVSVDWRLEAFKHTEQLRLCTHPFRYFSGGNVAFSRQWVELVGGFDEDFSAWGGEDNEYGYRLFRQGCFFRSLPEGLAYHQEPPGGENEIDRKQGKVITIPMVKDRVPIFYRKRSPNIENARIRRRPLVSIYIPAFNAQAFIVDCVNSALAQTVTDLEVVVCDDGSTDETLTVLQNQYEKNPRVRIVSQKNGGIGSASNTAVRNCRGHYIGQLDSDDLLLPDAVALCLHEFENDPNLGLVYTSNWNQDASTREMTPGYNWPAFSREKLATAMIVHHFRMFSARAWHMTQGFSEEMENAVDYDIYLKLSEVAPIKHINTRSYIRRLHGHNTSVKRVELQKENHFIAANNALNRQGIELIQVAPASTENPGCRKYCFKNVGSGGIIN